MSESYEEILEDINNIGGQGLSQQQDQDNYTIRKAKSNLFFDDDTKIEFLAQERFPGDKNAAMKYVNIDGDLYYENPVGEKLFAGKKYTKEFPDNEAVGFFGDKITPNIVPASTFVSDVGGGMAGARQGFKTGIRLQQNIPNPYAKAAVIIGSTAIGGFGGNYLIGGLNRTAREATIDQFYSLTPEEIAAAHNDLLISSAFSLIPFGQGSVGTSRLLNVFNKDPDALRYLIELRGSTDDTIREANRLGFDLTPAQASTIGSRGKDIQYFLSRQPDARQVTQFYDSQASQIAEAITAYADDIGSQAGKAGDVNTRMVGTANRVLDELEKKRKQRATRLYDILKQAPEGIKVNNIDSVIDLIDSKIAGEVLDDSGKVIRVVEPPPTTVENLKEFKQMFYRQDGTLVDDLMELDARRTTEMKQLALGLQSKFSGDSGTIFSIMDSMTALMDESAPLYRQARRVYDPNKPSLQLVEKGAIGKFGKLMTDKQTATAMKNLFDPDVSLKSLRNSRRILRAVDPELFQDVKKQFLLDQYDKFFRAEQLQKGMPALQKHFQKNKIKAMMQEMLSPEEFENFYRMNELMGRAFSIPVGGSPTQPLTEMAGQIAYEGLGSGTKAAQTALALLNLPGRYLSGKLGEDVVARIAKDQQQGYLKLLIDQLIADPDVAKTLEDTYRFFNTNEFLLKQTGVRGAAEGVDAITDPSVQPYQGGQQPSQPTYEELLREIEGASGTTQAPQQPAFDLPRSDLAPPQMLSPTILPDERDREIAMRQMGGLGSLA